MREGAAALLDQGCQMNTAVMTTAMATKTGIRYFLTLNETVISLEVTGFALGMALSVVGSPFSILSSSENNSVAL